MFIPTGSKSTANEEPAPDEEMQWKYEVDEFGEANDIDNELKIRRWVIHQMVIDEKCVIRAADDFTGYLGRRDGPRPSKGDNKRRREDN
jgi:hypothetical protein